jgi:DNA modification methylase
MSKKPKQEGRADYAPGKLDTCGYNEQRQAAAAAAHNLHEDTGFFGLKPNVGPLKERFTLPPYSVWNTREGVWQNRRRLWLAKGIKSEEGRKLNTQQSAAKDEKYSKKYGKKITAGQGCYTQAASIFDPVVCELAYKWWCPPGGVVLDPFAGGSVRGIVASVLGMRYLGCELRGEQVVANREQVNPATRGEFAPKWREGDSTVLVPKAPPCDFFFSCPPYGNLEVYSDGEGDISNMTHAEFLVPYRAIIAAGVGKLKPNRFACFVVANYRSKDKNGKQMNDFVGDTIKAFEDAGAMFYNDIILVNAVGTGAMRANGTFDRGARKMVKGHQNVLVFIKGCPKEAAKHIPVDATASAE